MKKLCLMFLLYVSFWKPFASSQQFEIGNDSFVSYEVEAKAFGLIPNKIIGINTNIQGKIQIDPKIGIQLRFPVVSFRSGNTSRDESVAKILKYIEFPVIRFHLVSISDTVVTQVWNSDAGQFIINGELTVAGNSKQFDFIVNFKKETDSTVTFKTQTYAKFTDFGIDPPTLGYIVQIAPDRVLLKGELIVNIAQ